MHPTETLLDGLIVLDFSHRLPGPFATHLLANMGARVIKIEDHKRRDPFFEDGFFSQMDNSFQAWYRSLNSNKDILLVDFKSSEIKNQLKEKLQKADIIIMGLPPKLQQALGVTADELKGFDNIKACINLKASKNGMQNMHDLNAMADSDFLKLYVCGQKAKRLPPPFLPFSGIIFGQKTASAAIAAYLKGVRTKTLIESETYLFESTLEALGPFWPEELRQKGETKFLHNGAYPCYYIYQTNDGHYFALAAVEERFWVRLKEIFDLPLDNETRFSREEKYFQLMEDVFGRLDKDEIVTKLKGEDLCLSFI